ncbi:MAG TPA: rhomboid family intramembrane serine protease [Dysgonomonas sp.]|nr:rhomboid family intramembrane serine protease [Dysgonomonas sp.]
MFQNRGGILGGIPPVTLNLIIITLICYIAQVLLGNAGIDITNYLGLHFYKSGQFYPHQLITYIFMHGSIMHFFFNMFAVFMLGRTLELVWGPKRYLFYYIITGIGAGVAQELVWLFELRDIVFNPDISSINIGRTIVERSEFWDYFVTIGASGSVFGILVAFGMFFPNAELMIIPIPVPIKAKYFVILYGALELFLGVSNTAGDNVAHFAHLGGLITGLFIVLYWKRKNKINGRFY